MASSHLHWMLLITFYSPHISAGPLCPSGEAIQSALEQNYEYGYFGYFASWRKLVHTKQNVFRYHGKHRNEMFGNTYILLTHWSHTISWMVINSHILFNMYYTQYWVLALQKLTNKTSVSVFGLILVLMSWQTIFLQTTLILHYYSALFSTSSSCQWGDEFTKLQTESGV